MPDDDDADEVSDIDAQILEEMERRRMQDHISYFGFSGTPKNKTLELFGRKDADGKFVPFHVYSMHQSISEGFTLDVLQNYTTFKRDTLNWSRVCRRIKRTRRGGRCGHADQLR